MMELSKIHIDESDFGVFLDLDDREKIEFLYQAQFMNKDIDIPFLKELGKLPPKPKQNPIINELFQDTFFEEQLRGKDRLTLLIINQYIHLNSTSIKWIRDIVHKLFDDGHIMMRVHNAKKLSEIDKYRFYRCYEILGCNGPISPN